VQTTDPIERRLEAVFDRQVPPDLGRLIDTRVRKAVADPSLRSSGPASDGLRPRIAGRRHRLVLALAATALLVAGGAAIAGGLLRGGVPPVMPDVARAMAGVRDLTMAECLDKKEVTQLIAAALGKAGVTDWSIATDGPVAHPIGEGEAMSQHLAAGCYVYSGSGWDADGRPVIYLAGPGS